MHEKKWCKKITFRERKPLSVSLLLFMVTYYRCVLRSYLYQCARGLVVRPIYFRSSDIWFNFLRRPIFLLFQRKKFILLFSFFLFFFIFLKLVSYMVACISPYDDDFKEYSFPVSQFAEFFNIGTNLV